ncbi:MAG TPA: VOC family protein [Actinophytocola sp.]|uniref:VOC family protein n=1 Tax=Actinophytocola sp. TaxID=1872138 RepID=UPI002DBC59AE|nr:VOC family protein [Actinophytocola sp.]HEU5473824.1 VOC family protein [Actinophytocola sp.]
MTEPSTESQEIEPGPPPWPPTLSPYIVVSDARRAVDWYVEVFGATRRGDLFELPDGSIGHAELDVGDAVLMLADESAEVPVRAPEPGTRTHSHSLHVQVDDVDAVTRRAEAAGAAVERAPADAPYGRGSTIIDPFGHRWLLLTPPGRATRHTHGEVSYVTMVVADEDRAKEFYGAVFGWRWRAGGVPGAWGPIGRAGAEFGIWADSTQRPEVQLCYRIHDIAAAVLRVRAAGGVAGEVERKPYGLMVECTDNQSARFQLWEPVD